MNPESTRQQPARGTRIGLETGLLVIVAVSLVGGLVSVGLVGSMGRSKWVIAVASGWACGGGAACLAWLLVALPMRLKPEAGMPLMAPIIATAVRLAVSIVGVALLLVLSPLPPLPLLFSTLAAYLVLMATESFLMYLTAPASGESGQAPETTLR